MSVDLLISLGSDAFNNHFDVVIPPFQGEGFDPFNIRIQTFPIPSSGSDTYERKYKGQTILLTSPTVTLEKTFTINFSVDEYYIEYKKVKLWKNAVVNTYTGAIGNLATLKVPITVMAKSTSTPDIPTQIWIFEGSRCISIGDISLDRNGTEAIMVDATFAYDRLNDIV